MPRAPSPPSQPFISLFHRNLAPSYSQREEWEPVRRKGNRGRQRREGERKRKRGWAGEGRLFTYFDCYFCNFASSRGFLGASCAFLGGGSSYNRLNFYLIVRPSFILSVFHTRTHTFTKWDMQRLKNSLQRETDMKKMDRAPLSGNHPSHSTPQPPPLFL